MSASDNDIYDVDEADFDDLVRTPILLTERHEGKEIKVWRLGTNDRTPYYALNMERSKFVSHLVISAYPSKPFQN